MQSLAKELNPRRCGQITDYSPASFGPNYAGIPGLVKQNPLTVASNSLHGSSKTPVTSAESHEQDINALISQYSTEPKAANPSIKQENEFNLGLATLAKSQELSLGSPTIVTRPSNNGIAGVRGHIREASVSDMPEGEIPEPQRVLDKKAQGRIKPTEAEVKESSQSREELQRPSQERYPKADAIAHEAALKRAAQADYRESDHRDEERRRPEAKPEPKRTPTLEALLPYLREWLEITGYYNAPFRDKILSRRRAIAALDAQRMKLVAEME
ncbi:hypothetical protein VE03_10738, partial [Pseudogymnoascus sp. 23342-1-I1]